jgi:heterodisulfide reductase subunit C
MDLLPNQVIRFIQLGLKDDLLESQAFWVCASCLTCNARCPKGIKIAEVMEAVRQILLRQKKERLVVARLTDRAREEVPPIALISSFRKYTS